MPELKCPFCGEKLVRHWGMKDPALYCCDNPKCSKGGIGTEQSWRALIDTKEECDKFEQHYKCLSHVFKHQIEVNDFLTDEANKLQKKLDIAVEELTKIKTAAESVGVGFFMTAAIFALAKIKNVEQIKDKDQQ